MKELNFEQMEQVKGGDFTQSYCNVMLSAGAIGGAFIALIEHKT